MRATTKLAALSVAALAGGVACASAAPSPHAATPSQGASSPMAIAASAPPVMTAEVHTPTITGPQVSPTLMQVLTRRLGAAVEGGRQPVKPYTFDPDDLERAALPTTMDVKEASKVDVSKLTEETDIEVAPANGYARSYMLTISLKDANVRAAHVRMNTTYGGASDTWFGEGYPRDTSVYQTCGFAQVSPVRFETVRIEKDHLVFTATEGWFDRMKCKFYRVSRTSARAKPLLPGGVMFGFRTCADAVPTTNNGTCNDEQLHVVYPRSSASSAGALGGGAERSTGSFSHVSFPLMRGGGGAFVARIGANEVGSWRLRKPAPATPNAASPTTPDPRLATAMSLQAMLVPFVQVGVEITQGLDDEEPVAIAYADFDFESIAASAPSAQAPGPEFGIEEPFEGRIRPSSPTPQTASRPTLVDPFLSRR